MLKYLIIQLDDTSVSFCHYPNDNEHPRLIELSSLKDALFWSMKENLTVQFLYPNYELPSEYKDAIASVDHADIVSSSCKDEKLRQKSDVVVFDSWQELEKYTFSNEQSYAIRTTFDDLFANADCLQKVLPKVTRLNIIITDTEKLNVELEKQYSDFLSTLTEMALDEFKKGHGVQLNILTDRMMLDKMNNCGAGDETITLAPDGKFYICPGFYLDGSVAVGDLENGLDIKNAQLYKLGYAPICRTCDAWHCKRCIWQNKNTTLEVNTPSREQCVMTHLERNASRKLLAKIREIGEYLPGKEIPEIDYLDPFDKLQHLI